MPKLRTQSFFPSTLTIDGVEIAVRVKRLTNTQCDAYAEALAATGTPRGPEDTPDAAREREAAAANWARESLDAYLSIVPGEYEHDGREVTKGGELIEIFGARQDVVPMALALILLENRLSEAQKKTSRLALAIRFGSANAPQTVASGSVPEPIAENVAPPTSAEPADATAHDSDELSGTTGPSNFALAPSGV